MLFLKKVSTTVFKKYLKKVFFCLQMFQVLTWNFPSEYEHARCTAAECQVLVCLIMYSTKCNCSASLLLWHLTPTSSSWPQ